MARGRAHHLLKGRARRRGRHQKRKIPRPRAACRRRGMPPRRRTGVRPSSGGRRTPCRCRRRDSLLAAGRCRRHRPKPASSSRSKGRRGPTLGRTSKRSPRGRRRPPSRCRHRSARPASRRRERPFRARCGTVAAGPDGAPAFKPVPRGPNVAAPRFIDMQKGRKEHVEAGGRRVIEEPGNRFIVKQDNRAVIRHDEAERFRRLADARSERRPRRHRRHLLRAARRRAHLYRGRRQRPAGAALPARPRTAGNTTSSTTAASCATWRSALVWARSAWRS